MKFWSKQGLKQAQEPKGSKEFVICKECDIVYFHKSWHHRLEQDIKHLREDKNIKFDFCPTCRMKKDKVFEGIVILENLPPKIKPLIMQTVLNMGSTAFELDPLDRILNIKDMGSKVEIWTSENQLAQKIGKKIDRSFKGGELRIEHSKDDLVARVWWHYKKEDEKLP